MRCTKEKGITLIALIITIIVLLILAGVSISLMSGDNGILNKASSASAKTESESVKEELTLLVTNKIADLSTNSQKVSMGEIVNYLSDKVDSLDNDGKNGIYKDYTFYIDPTTFKVIMGDKNTENIVPSNDKAILLDGGTYINTNIQESDLLVNSKFTIAARVYIDANVQKTMQYMDILGNHLGSGGTAYGFVWQFYTNTSTLLFAYPKSLSIAVDYTPYYNKWNDIVMTYDSGKTTIYMNTVKVGEKDGMIITPYYNLLIGTGYTGENRALRGMISSVKIWTKVVDDISKINMYSNIKNPDSNLLMQLDFADLAQIQAIGNIVGTNYKFVENKNNIKYAFNFRGSTFLDTKLSQSQILSKGAFTIASRVFINRSEQQTITYMDILGNHTGSTGIVWQFTTTTTQLGGMGFAFDYTPYYGKWTDIIATYNNGVQKIYLDKTLISQGNVTYSPYGNLLVGTGFTGSDRAMKGKMESTRVWNTDLSSDDINSLDLSNVNNIKNESILLDLDFKNLSSLQSKCNFSGSGYEYLLDE